MQRFMFDDLHIAINRNPDNEVYETWATIDAITSTVIMLLAVSGLLVSGRVGILCIILISTFLYVKGIHYLLQNDYEAIDIKLAKIYSGRVFDDYYDFDWFKQYKAAKADPDMEQERFVDLYIFGINRALGAHLILAMAGLIISFVTNKSPIMGVLATSMQVCQSVMCFRFLHNELNHSFARAYVDEPREPHY